MTWIVLKVPLNPYQPTRNSVWLGWIVSWSFLCFGKITFLLFWHEDYDKKFFWWLYWHLKNTIKILESSWKVLVFLDEVALWTLYIADILAWLDDDWDYLNLLIFSSLNLTIGGQNSPWNGEISHWQNSPCLGTRSFFEQVPAVVACFVAVLLKTDCNIRQITFCWLMICRYVYIKLMLLCVYSIFLLYIMWYSFM